MENGWQQHLIEERFMRVPTRTARRCRTRRCSRRVFHCHLDGGLDGSSNPFRTLSGEMLSGGSRPRHGSVYGLYSLRPRPFRGGLDCQSDLLNYRQRVRLQSTEVSPPGRHADTAPLHKDLPGSAPRHRDGARVPQQIRASAAGAPPSSPSSAFPRAITGGWSTRRCEAGSISLRTTRTSTANRLCAGATATCFVWKQQTEFPIL